MIGISDKPVTKVPVTNQGWKIRRSRERLDLTTTELGKVSGIGRAHLQNLEYGERFNPDLNTLKKLCLSLELDPKELF